MPPQSSVYLYEIGGQDWGDCALSATFSAGFVAQGLGVCLLHCNFGVIANAACHLLLAKLQHKSELKISRPLRDDGLIYFSA